MNLLNTPVTVAQTNVLGVVLQTRGAVSSLALFAQFNFGSGGTSADAYVQTSMDGGLSWFDIANFHFLVASGKALFTLFAGTPKTTQLTAFTDGALASNTALDGALGNQFRVKYTTVGTYAGGTSLRVDAVAAGLTIP
jgi:hypothetical protein